MAVHVMLDWETLSTANNALPWAVGAVRFDADTILDRFEVGIDAVDAERYGLKIDASTVMYWLSAGCDEARKKLLELPKIDAYAAIDGLNIFANQTPVGDRGSLWGNGATFDNVIYESACRALGLDSAFGYRQHECYRTLRNRIGHLAEFTQIGVKHTPADDAESQARHMQAICKAAGIAL